MVAKIKEEDIEKVGEHTSQIKYQVIEEVDVPGSSGLDTKCWFRRTNIKMKGEFCGLSAWRKGGPQDWTDCPLTYGWTWVSGSKCH